MTLYHYTVLRDEDHNLLLQKILKSEEISLRGTYFAKFSDKDYGWIKKYSKKVVKKICEDNNEFYDIDMLDCRPYIISFSPNGKSSYLWKKYGNKGYGMKLAFDGSILINAHATDEEIDCLLPCKYLIKKRNIERNIQKVAQHENLAGWGFFERLKMAVVAMKNHKFEKEEEYRYISLHRDIGTFCQGIFQDYQVSPNEWYKYITFPKNALVGITLGVKTTEKDYQEIREYVKKCGLDPKIVIKNK